MEEAEAELYQEVNKINGFHKALGYLEQCVGILKEFDTPELKKWQKELERIRAKITKVIG